MEQRQEKRGPIEKGEKGWPVNPIGVAALIVFSLIVIFLIVRPLLGQKTTIIQQSQQEHAAGGAITTPGVGDIIKENNLTIKLSVDKPSDVEKVQFWAKTYADGRWQMIGEVKSQPLELDWQIPPEFQNKAVALTSHIYKKDGSIIKDPGGWREGIIILGQ